ncbi:MAG: peptidoglycan-associated lipoprotein Pal [Gammaproteobacteria bacterium]|nr:peptidoglycan-associated lipoprotein Pal [Gammaproteobacteria bacterium]MBU1480439.1 peptidoglycan-associated lipoprotein Pal [Gammaproteobacteria bacterium]
MKKIFLSIVLVNLLAACASETPKEAVEEPTPAVTETEATAPVEPAQAPVETVEAAMPEERSVYFPFDVDAVQAADRAIVQAHGDYLSKNADAKVRVEGNADERGSSEYNLALGQRRANNVKKLLILSGAQASQIETMSFGEEKPRCAEHNESCWSQNRRADIVAK